MYIDEDKKALIEFAANIYALDRLCIQVSICTNGVFSDGLLKLAGSIERVVGKIPDSFIKEKVEECKTIYGLA